MLVLCGNCLMHVSWVVLLFVVVVWLEVSSFGGIIFEEDNHPVEKTSKNEIFQTSEVNRTP